jgi:hypothetical protein
MRSLVFLAVLASTLVPAATVSAESAAEKRVAQQIGSHLKQSGQLHDYRVGVKFRDGVAYLAGNVSSIEQRDLAVRLAQQVDGVTHVVSKLEFPIEGDLSNNDRAETSAGGDRRQLSAELDRASYEGAQRDSKGVMQAYQPMGDAQAAPLRQHPNMQSQVQRQGPHPFQMRRSNMPLPAGRLPGMMMARQNGLMGVNQASGACPSCNGGAGMVGMGGGEPAPVGFVPAGSGRGPSYDNAQMPAYAWPSYASYPNYAALTYPQQYSPTAWPYIGPFYPYPQVPLAWRKVSLEWDDGWWFLDFSSHNSSH